VNHFKILRNYSLWLNYHDESETVSNITNLYPISTVWIWN